MAAGIGRHCAGRTSFSAAAAIAAVGGFAVSDGPETIVLIYLRRLDTKMDKLADDMIDVAQRPGHLEGQYASISRRVDSLDIRLERVERRLDIVAVD
jgi:hypothetical protein